MATTNGPRRRGRRKAEGPHPTDVHVGSRVRLRRNDLGLSQEKLAQDLGLTFQQIQKYERGSNRIGASRLFEIARILGVSVEFLFQGRPQGSERTFAPGFAEAAQQAFE